MTINEETLDKLRQPNGVVILTAAEAAALLELVETWQWEKGFSTVGAA
jgi:hypothetical protein